MVKVSIRDGIAVFEPLGMHKFWTLRRRIEAPLASIRAVRPDPNVTLGWWKGWRVPGTHVPGLIVAGTFYRDGQRTFWDVTRRKQTIVVELSDGFYDQLIIDVADPRATVEMLQSAIRSPAA